MVIFIVLVFWMGGLLYILVWMVFFVGFIYNILECVMGMIFFVVGSSFLDVIVSLVVVK